MPFTPAHAVAALPFRRTRLDLAALVVGCLSPDFEYFLRGEPQGSFGHTLTGLLILDLPLSLLVLWLYRRYMKIALHAAAPKIFPFANVLAETSPSRTICHPAFTVVSILVGGATHIVWDSFTHPIFWPYRHIALLHKRFPSAGGLELYKVLQHGSTVFGMSVLLLLWWRWVRSASDPRAPVLKPAGMLLVLFAFVITSLRVLLATSMLTRQIGFSLLASRSVITLLDAFALAVVIYGAALRQQPSL